MFRYFLCRTTTNSSRTDSSQTESLREDAEGVASEPVTRWGLTVQCCLPQQSCPLARPFGSDRWGEAVSRGRTSGKAADQTSLCPNLTENKRNHGHYSAVEQKGLLGRAEGMSGGKGHGILSRGSDLHGGPGTSSGSPRVAPRTAGRRLEAPNRAATVTTQERANE